MSGTAASHPTRASLLAAGLRLAERGGLSDLSVNAIVKEAGVAKGTFYVHFPERRDYFVALHRDFHDALERRIDDATTGPAAVSGRARLAAGVHAYLEACLEATGVKALLLEARAEPAVDGEVRARNARLAQRAQHEFAAMGWRDPAASARLFVAMAAEAALAELEAGKRVPAMRRAVEAFLGE